MIRSFALPLILPTLLSAQAVAPVQPAEHRQRREALAAAIGARHEGEQVLVVLRGGPKQPDMGSFAQDQDFLWLSGVAEPTVALLLVVDGGELTHDELLVPPYSPFSAKWDGRFLAPGEASAKATGFAEVGNVRSLPRRLKELAAQRDSQPWTVITATRPAARLGSTSSKSGQAAAALSKDPLDGRQSREAAFGDALAELMPGVKVESLERYVHKLRPHKSPAELALLRRSTEIAAEGIGEAMRSVRPGVYEYQLAAVARCIFSLHGCGPDAYAAIVGGGPNGCILHYNACDRQLRDDDLIVMDYAATLHGYCSDVTRTFPASGTFTKAQRKLVTDVYEVQQALLAEVKPGARLSQLGGMCARMLVERGYKNDHGPCHHVGLAVHDPSVDRLEPGMVITVEPGAYLPKQGYGCRIEDCVLVTADGCEVMSKGVPSHPDAIEQWMKQAPRIVIPE
ncbi:MAG: aminopeptidase P family protein [Planctomycetes bacterium]|nr:aminopeptidase P family protein [Planctomycetota bacterium]